MAPKPWPRLSKSVSRSAGWRRRPLPAAPALPLPGGLGARPRLGGPAPSPGGPDCACAGHSLRVWPGGRRARLPGSAVRASPVSRPLAGLLPCPGSAAAAPGPAADTLLVRPPARWKRLPESPSAVRRRKRCRGRGEGWREALTSFPGF